MATSIPAPYEEFDGLNFQPVEFNQRNFASVGYVGATPVSAAYAGNERVF